MEHNYAEIRFWETVYHLAGAESFQIIHLNEEGCIVWFEDVREKKSSILRLQLKSYDWSNQLRGDINRVYSSAKTVRKKLKLPRANVTNVIMAPYPPVDSYEQFTSRPLPLTAGGKNQMRTILLPLQEMQEQLFPLATEWKLRDMPSYLPDKYLESEEEQEMYLRRMKRKVKRLYEDKQEEERSVFMHGTPSFTFALIIAVFAVFLYVEMEGSSTSTLTLIEMGAKFDPLILEGEWWRFFSAMFLHIGFLHLFMNSLALFFLGGAVERIFGSGRFLVVYFVAGFFGSVSSFVFNDNISAGASGAIFGLFGALLYFGTRYRRLFFRTFGVNIVVILIINLVFGFTVPMIDNGAHIGGLVGGFAAAAAVGLPGKKVIRTQPLAGAAAVVGAFILLFIGYSQDVESGQLQVIYYEMGRESVEAENMENAVYYLEEARDMEGGADIPIPEDELNANIYFLLAYAHLQEDNLAKAEENLWEALEIREDFHEAYYNLALVYYEQGEYEEALDLIQEAIAIEETEEYLDLENEIQDEITG